jgi:hypothetical protein
MHDVEKRFREAERQLDEMFRKDAAALAGRRIAVTEESGRAYHYQNEHLFWRLRFETRSEQGSEIQKVWGWLSLNEHDTNTLKVWRRAEIFQMGKQSRWHDTVEELLPLAEAARRGLASIILEAIDGGEAAAAENF